MPLPPPDVRSRSDGRTRAASKRAAPESRARQPGVVGILARIGRSRDDRPVSVGHDARRVGTLLPTAKAYAAGPSAAQRAQSAPMERHSTAAHAAVEAAVASQREALLRIARRSLGAVADAEDLVQLAVVRALARSTQLRDPHRASAWVGRIARNALQDELRKRGARTEPLGELDLAEAPAEEPPCWCVLAQAEQLRPEYARILRRVDIEGARVLDVAAELGITPNNAMVRLHRARRALREQLRSHCGMTCATSCSDCGCEERGCCPKPT